MKITYLIYIVSDSHGTKAATVANEASDTVQICGMCDTDDKPLYFESDAYHLPSWCIEHGLNFNKIEMDAHV